MHSQNNYILTNFLSKDNSNLDGLISNSIENISYLRKLINSNEMSNKTYMSLNSFLNEKENIPKYCFINVDKTESINEEDSLSLFRKTRGKTKIILFNKASRTLKQEHFYTFINWMRVVVIE
jgi:hypothetical protein